MKNHKSLFLHFAFISSLFIMTGCASNTNITASWDNPDVGEKSYSNVFVTALVDDISARQKLENELVRELQEQGLQAAKSLDIFPPKLGDEKMRTKEELLDAIEENKFDAVITVALIDQENEARYVPGNYPYAPVTAYGYYGTFWGYYNYWYPQMYAGGYYDVDRSYFLETNLYDASSEKLVWSAQSKTVNPISLETFSEDYAAKIIESMKKENLFKQEE